ncbi:hypothetical protein LSAT2_019134, partial [Lamellibrachia satsuma]
MSSDDYDTPTRVVDEALAPTSTAAAAETGQSTRCETVHELSRVPGSGDDCMDLASTYLHGYLPAR